MAHSVEKELIDRISAVQELVEVGGVYFHYKNPLLHYKVLALGLQESDEAVCVVYQSLYGDSLIWVRNSDSWLEKIANNGKMVSRFEKLLSQFEF